MWGLPIGVIMGVSGYAVNKRFAGKLAQLGTKGASRAAALAVIKFIVVYGVFCLLALAGAGVLLFAAGGYVAALLTLAIGAGVRAYRGGSDGV